jgi:hypothetical protein
MTHVWTPENLEVLCTRRPWLRDPHLEMELFMGRGVLDNIFDEFRVTPKTTHIYLAYPERWTNIIEQRLILPRVAHYYPDLQHLQIKTHSVYILQCCPNVCVKLYTDEEQPDGLSSEVAPDGGPNLTGKTCSSNHGNLFGDGIGVVTSSGIRDING